MRHTILLVAAVAASNLASAQTLVNGSFENPDLGTSNYSYTTQPTGWTGTGALVNATGSSAFYGATPPAGQDGQQFYALQGKSSIFENFTADQSGMLTVSWLSAGRPDGGTFGGDQSYDVSLTGSGIELGSLGTFTTTSGQAFARLAGTGTVTAGQIYSVSFRGLSSTDETAFIDGVSLSWTAATATADSVDVSATVDAVPEPATWAMMLLGFGMVGGASRRRHP